MPAHAHTVWGTVIDQHKDITRELDKTMSFLGNTYSSMGEELIPGAKLT